jgi:hypothetical protein
MIAAATRAKATTTATTAGVPDNPAPATPPLRTLPTLQLIQRALTTHLGLRPLSLDGVDGLGALGCTVRSTHSHMLGVVDRFVQQTGNVTVVEGVNRSPTLALSVDETQSSQ